MSVKKEIIDELKYLENGGTVVNGFYIRRLLNKGFITVKSVMGNGNNLNPFCELTERGRGYLMGIKDATK